MSGVAQLDTPFAGWLPIGGVLLSAGMVLLTLAVCFYYLIEKRWRAALIALGVALAASLGVNAISWRSDSPQKIDIALVQGNIPQALKLRPEFLGLSLHTYRELSREHLDADLIIWPETAMPAYQHDLQAFLQALREELSTQKAVVLTGIFLQAENGLDYYNAMSEIGGQDQQYSKHRLVPFGEYVPFKWLMRMFSAFVDIPRSDMSSAPLRSKPFNLAGVQSSVSICYEIGYPDVLRAQLPEAVLMINTSNDAWFGDSLAPHQHLEMARARAKAFARPVARSTNTGLTGFIDTDGTILGLSRQFEPNAIRHVIATNDTTTPFTLVGQRGVGYLFILLTVCLMCLSRAVKRRDE